MPEPIPLTPERKQLIDCYVQGRVATRICDANNSTSWEQEFDHCYRHGCPDPNTMSDKELLAEIHACCESLGDDLSLALTEMIMSLNKPSPTPCDSPAT